MSIHVPEFDDVGLGLLQRGQCWALAFPVFWHEGTSYGLLESMLPKSTLIRPHFSWRKLNLQKYRSHQKPHLTDIIEKGTELPSQNVCILVFPKNNKSICFTFAHTWVMCLEACRGSTRKEILLSIILQQFFPQMQTKKVSINQISMRNTRFFSDQICLKTFHLLCPLCLFQGCYNMFLKLLTLKFPPPVPHSQRITFLEF